VEEFLDLVRTGYDRTSIPFIRKNLVVNISILVYIGWPGWSRLRLIYDHKDEKGGYDRLDDRLLNLRYGWTSFLGRPWGNKFIQHKDMFCPVTLGNDRTVELEPWSRLPFVNASSEKFREGTFSETYEEIIAAGQLVQKHGSPEQVRLTAIDLNQRNKSLHIKISSTMSLLLGSVLRR
jgi:hypothetical protein